MPPGSQTPTMDTPPYMPATSSAPLQPTTSPAALETHGNDIATSPSTPLAEPNHSKLTSSDCSTLKKILDDSKFASPAPSPMMKQQNKSLLSVAAPENGSSDTGNEDEVTYTRKQYGHGDELEAGYEDEDDSMELSDGDLNGDDAEGSDDGEYVWSDGDTIEDIMNTPGATAPPARPQHLDGIYQHNSPPREDSAEIQAKRAAIEEAVKKERVNQENKEALGVAYEPRYLDLVAIEEQDGAFDLSEELMFQAMQNTQAHSGLSRIEEADETEFELDRLNANERRTSRRFSPAPISRRASEESLPVSSFQAIQDARPTVVATPSGNHLAFTPSSTIPITSFTKTLKDFKKYSGKENSPSKSRRNASLPEEIAELAKEAKEEEDLEKYREIDLAPMEPIIESKSAGDLITFGTPARSNIVTPPIDTPSPTQVPHKAALFDHARAVETLILLAKSPMDSKYVEMPKAISVETQATSPKAVASPLPAEQHGGDETDPADPENSDATCGPECRQLSLYQESPTFVKVVALLPETMFWVAAAPVVKYSSMVYEAMVSKFTKLEL